MCTVTACFNVPITIPASINQFFGSSVKHFAADLEITDSPAVQHLDVTTFRGVFVVVTDSAIITVDGDTAGIFDCCVNVLLASAIVNGALTANIKHRASLAVTVVSGGANPSVPVAESNICEVGVAGGIGFAITTSSRVEADVAGNARGTGENARARERGERE